MSSEPSTRDRGESVYFSVDSHLLLELGERLVARKSIALGELVKNAYDADATKVTVRLVNVTKPHGTIVVEDNGIGMTFKQVTDGWMRIATTAKMREPRSPQFRRLCTGQKGVGRFACRLLADTLKVESVAYIDSRRKERITVAIDWTEFEPGTTVETIPVRCFREEADQSAPTGVTLTLANVRDVWRDEDVLELRRDLIGLTSPFGAMVSSGGPSGSSGTDPGFRILLQAPEFEDISGELAEQILKHAWARLEATVNKKGEASYAATVRRPTRRTYQFNPKERLDGMGATTLVINAFVWRHEYIGDLGISVREAQKLGNEQGGVRIYLDGFRVLPYGEPGDDWLNLDGDRGRRLQSFRFLEQVDEELKRPGLYLFGNNQLFGAVFLSRDQNPNLQPTITRDRLVSNVAFDQLKRLVRLGVEWLTVIYAREKARQDAKDREGRRREDPVRPLEEAIAELRERETELGTEVVAELTHTLELARDAVLQRENERINELSMLRVLATTGTMVSILDHELATMVGRVRNISRELKEISESRTTEREGRLVAKAEELREWADTVEQYGLQLSILLGREARSRRRILPLRPLLDDMERPFARHLKEIGAKFENEVPPELRLPAMYQCEIHSIFLNLLTNSAKAVLNSTQRRICVQARKDGTRLRIHFLDTGPGIAPERREEVFKPFESDSEPDPMLGTGTGLGLTVVREIVETYGGSIHFVDPPPGWGACVEIVFPL